ncbi:MAG TPA: aspartate/glutamate racemase family protein [Burkholderiales bacterium]|nr:aspartate/glutamate racemase family protein [Burkholderiales bacterium]
MNAVHVGLMVPINNTTMERELSAWLPSGSACTTLRIPRGKGLLTSETLPEYKAQALSLARQLADPAVDVVAYGCTAAGFISGPAGDAALQGELGAVTGKPVVTIARSMVLALQEAGAREIALVTPYLDTVNDQLKAFLADGGIRVRRFNSFYAQNVDELGKIEAPAVARLARETMDDGCDSLFIACSQLPTYEILGDLEREFGRPALSSVQVTARKALRAAQRVAA